MDKDIQLQHNNVTPYWTSGTKIVSELYVYKQLQLAIKRIAELEQEIKNVSSPI